MGPDQDGTRHSTSHFLVSLYAPTPQLPSYTFSFSLSLLLPCWALWLFSTDLPYFRGILSYAAFTVKEKDLFRHTKYPRWAWGLREKHYGSPATPEYMTWLTNHFACENHPSCFPILHYPISPPSFLFSPGAEMPAALKGTRLKFPEWNHIFCLAQIKRLI